MAEWLATVVPALGHALLQFLWQGTLIGVVTMLALHGLRNARPQLRYAVAGLALLACVLVPLLNVIAQLTAGTPWPSPAVAWNLLPGSASGQPVAGMLDVVVPVASAAWIVMFWAVGCAVMLLRMALGIAWIHRLRQTPLTHRHTQWQGRLDALALRFGLRRSVSLRLVDCFDSPVSAGWWRPVVLLPTALLTRMPVDLVEALLAHELAHIRRHDYLVNLLQAVVEALLFYHPVVWWLSRRIRHERELVADQLAAEATGAPRRLALALSELSEFQHAGCEHGLAQAAHGGHLLPRIRRLLHPAAPVRRPAVIVVSMLAMAAACVAVCGYAVTPDAGERNLGVRVQPVRAAHVTPASTFALVRKSGETWTLGPDGDDQAAIAAARAALDDDFLWIRRVGTDYAVRDTALLARARQAWHQTDLLGQQLQQLSRQMERHQASAELLRARMQSFSTSVDGSSDAGADAVDAHGRAAGSDPHALAEAAEDRQQTLAETAEDQRQRQIEAAEDRRQVLIEAWSALVREAAQATHTMQGIAEDIESVTRERQEAAVRTEQTLRTLADQAIATGLAQRMAAPG